MISGMRVGIDKAGRIIIPKPIRAHLDLVEGRELELEEHDGVIEIRPVPVEVDIVETEDGVIAEPRHDVETIDDEAVRKALESTRR